MAYKGIPLGEQTIYQFSYDASLLFPIAREESRVELDLPSELPFNGVDRWTAYELSWLDANGKPQVAIAEFDFDAASPNLVESKSFKLYLNSFNQTQFESQSTMTDTLVRDLSVCSGKPVVVNIFPVDSGKFMSRNGLNTPFVELDSLQVTCNDYDCNESLLQLNDDVVGVQSFVSHLFRSLCPVTSQPDWASIFIRVHGKEIVPESLLQYLVSYRNHQGFHEQCVEKVFSDLKHLNAFSEVEVYARFLRRGGLDINPYRYSKNLSGVIPDVLAARQ